MDVTATQPDPQPGPDLADLPRVVADRVVGLAAGVLPELTPVPAPLRRVAGFAPARRARLGGPAITVALTRDDELRSQVAERLTPAESDPARDESGDRAGDRADTGGPTEDADPARAAALTWLLRPEGWVASLDTLLARLAEEDVQRQAAQEDAESTRLRAALASQEEALREHRARAREQAESLRAENTVLRRRLGESRAATRAAEAEAAASRRVADVATSTATAEVSVREAELRRLRSRVAELEISVGAERSEARTRRDDSSLRARLLLDALLEAGQGLRRELGLPAVEGSPSARLEEALLAAAGEGPAGGVAAGPVSVLQLEGWLQMPRARLLVDGYNVSKAAWPESSLDAQRTRLLVELAPLVSRSGAETTVVFDAAATTSRGLVSPPRGLKVVFSPPGVIADDVLRDLVAVEPAGRTVLVVSSDQEVMRDVRRAGARAVPSQVLIQLLRR